MSPSRLFQKSVVAFVGFVGFGSLATASDSASRDACLRRITEIGVKDPHKYQNFCDSLQQLKSCQSVNGEAIWHWDAKSAMPKAKNVLVFGMIHGDEPLSAQLALEWIARLPNIPFRNSWRIVPFLNPDGMKLKTRMNARGIDLNRNFPTKDWNEGAKAHWQKSQRSDPRRFPGDAAASEPETQCAIAHIVEFQPDFIVSVHTPYRVLDFDGPRLSFPAYKELPWRALGNFPGSLGRFMWKDYGTPVLTVELATSMVSPDPLQDVIGSLIQGPLRSSGQKPSFMGLVDFLTAAKTF